MHGPQGIPRVRHQLCQSPANVSLVGAAAHTGCLPPGPLLRSPGVGWAPQLGPGEDPAERPAPGAGRRHAWRAARRCRGASPPLDSCQGEGQPEAPLVCVPGVQVCGCPPPGLPGRSGAVWRKRARRTPEEVSAYTRVFFLIPIVQLSEVCSAELPLPGLSRSWPAGVAPGDSGRASSPRGQARKECSWSGRVTLGQSFPALGPAPWEVCCGPGEWTAAAAPLTWAGGWRGSWPGRACGLAGAWEGDCPPMCLGGQQALDWPVFGGDLTLELGSKRWPVAEWPGPRVAGSHSGPPVALRSV